MFTVKMNPQRAESDYCGSWPHRGISGTTPQIWNKLPPTCCGPLCLLSRNFQSVALAEGTGYMWCWGRCKKRYCLRTRAKDVKTILPKSTDSSESYIFLLGWQVQMLPPLPITASPHQGCFFGEHTTSCLFFWGHRDICASPDSHFLKRWLLGALCLSEGLRTFPLLCFL